MATLDATLGGSESNSYVTLAEAEAYAANRPNSAWHSGTDDEKNESLIAATFWLETLEYKGDRCSPSTDDANLPQSLKWPRSGVTCDGIVASCSFIPKQIKNTQIELAMQYIANSSLFPNLGSGGTAPTGTYVKRQKLDVLEIEYDEFSNPQSSSCDSCGDPAIIQSFPWLADLLGCWALGVQQGDNKMIALYRN